MTTPPTRLAPCFNVKVVDVMVSGFIGTLNVAATTFVKTTPMAALAGSVEITVGDTPAVNVQT